MASSWPTQPVLEVFLWRKLYKHPHLPGIPLNPSTLEKGGAFLSCKFGGRHRATWQCIAFVCLPYGSKDMNELKHFFGKKIITKNIITIATTNKVSVQSVNYKILGFQKLS